MNYKNPYSHPNEKSLYGIFNDSFPPIMDGVTLTVQNYAHWLAEKGKRPCIVTPWNPVSHETPYDVMRFFSLPIQSRYPYRYGYPKCDPFIWRRLRSTDFKLVHAHCPFSSGRLGVYVKRKQGVPLIGTFHSKYREDLKHSFKLFPFCVPIIMNRILNFFNSCDQVWIPQSHVAETVREYGYKGELTVVENGNDFADIIKGDVASYRKQKRLSAGIKDDELSLLFVGQHIWEKGIGLILDSLEILKDRIPIRMNFIGNGYAAIEIKKRIKALGLDDKVKLHGVVKERGRLSDFYAASDIFVFPSFYDNAPLVVREAAAMSTPSLLLRGSTASEVVSDGRNGFLSDNSPRQMAELIEHLYYNRAMLKEVGEGARKTLVRSWENVVDEVAQRYDDLTLTLSRKLR